MVETVIDAFQDADVILWLVDASTMPGPDDRDLAEKLAAVADQIPVIIGMNKVDLLTPDKVIPTSEAYRELLPDAAWLLFSADKGRGLQELYRMLLEQLPLGPRYYPEDQITDIFVRNIAAEMVREQVMLQLREEIPIRRRRPGRRVQGTGQRRHLHQGDHLHRTRLTQAYHHRQKRCSTTPFGGCRSHSH